MGNKNNTILQPDKNEVAMVKLLAAGMTGEDVCIALKIKPHDLGFSLSVLRSKYNCKNSTELVAVFLREGFID